MMKIDAEESKRTQLHFIVHLEVQHAKLSLPTSTRFAVPYRIQTAQRIKSLLAPTISATTKAIAHQVSRVKTANQ